ncbi:hypothetical protein QJS66_18830 [Kocuria rhizophila]|nr:hypothetical protein QJS66_18830 [Kocuria rhizophila]
MTVGKRPDLPACPAPRRPGGGRAIASRRPQNGHAGRGHRADLPVGAGRGPDPASHGPPGPGRHGRPSTRRTW